MAMLQTEVVQQCSVVTEVYQTETPTLHLQQTPSETTQSNYVKIIKSIGAGSVVDILPSVVEHIVSNTNKIERSELIQEMARKLKDEAIMWQLVKHNLLNSILSQLLDIFSGETSQSIQFELMTVICSLPQSHLTEKLLSKLHSAALSSSPLIRRQSLLLVLKTLPPNVSLKFLLAYLDDDDPRVRTTAIQHLHKAADSGCDIPFSVYHKLIANLSDSFDEVRLHSVRLLPHLVKQHRHEHLETTGSRTTTLTHHTFVQLCMLMRDMSTNVRSEVARVLGLFTDVDPEYLKQTLDKKIRSSMRILPAGSKMKQEYASGRKWGGDAPIKTVSGEINIFDPAGCGAFIHGMEDEFRAVRSNTVQAMCDLSTSCPEYGAVSMSHLVDMLNDETGGVRLLAIRSLQLISESVHLHEDQLETVMSVLEESNVEIRHSLHSLLSSCKLNSQVAVRRVLKGLLDNLKKYPQDKSSIYKCVQGVGGNNPNFVSLLAPEMLSKHPYLAQTEPSTDDTSYVATMILVFNAAKHNSVIFSFFHSYTPKHYVYIYSLLPELVPQLPQVHKILKGSDVSANIDSITSSLNLILKQFLNLCKSGAHIAAMTKTLENIEKIQKCSTRIHPQTKYASLLVNILLQLSKLRNIDRKRMADGHHRVLSKIKDIVCDLCLFQTCFRGSDHIVFLGKLLKFYFIQFLHQHIAIKVITDEDIARYRDHVLSFAGENNLPVPTQIRDDRNFNLLQYIHSQDTLVTSDTTHSRATILSPQSNTERVNEFPSHLSYSVKIEAETHHVEPQNLAVKVRYPGFREVVCQPVVQNHLQDYYQNTVFVGGVSWSDPGLIQVSLVTEYKFEEYEECLAKLYGEEKVWLEISDSVQLKIHPRPSK